MITTAQLPRQNQTYTLAEIEQFLQLKDSPCLMILVDGRYAPIQDSHYTADDRLATEGWKETEWTYKYTTSEWIPVFYSANDSVRDLLDIVKMEAQYDGDDEYWIVPKAFPRNP